MHIKNGIAYAGECEKAVTVVSARVLEGHTLLIRFSTGEVKKFDFTPLLSAQGFKALADTDLFNSVYIEYGVPVWCDGEIDISPEYLYQHGVNVCDETTSVAEPHKKYKSS